MKIRNFTAMASVLNKLLSPEICDGHFSTSRLFVPVQLHPFRPLSLEDSLPGTSSKIAKSFTYIELLTFSACQFRRTALPCLSGTGRRNLDGWSNSFDGTAATSYSSRDLNVASQVISVTRHHSTVHFSGYIKDYSPTNMNLLSLQTSQLPIFHFFFLLYISFWSNDRSIHSLKLTTVVL